MQDQKSDPLPLKCLVRPALNPSSQPPLLLLLHGVGSNEDDLFGLAEAFPPEFAVLSVRAPLSLGPGSYAWFPVRFGPEGPVIDAAAAEASRVLLTQFLDAAVARYGADPAAVFVVGFSQGAIMAASLALTEPDRVAGVALLSGRILPEVLPRVAPLNQRTKPAYLVVHGTEDERLPLFHGQASRATLQRLGIEPDYHEFAMGHTISAESLDAVVSWLSRTRERNEDRG